MNNNHQAEPVYIESAMCPMPIRDRGNIILGHGSGGKLSHDLIAERFLPAFDNPVLRTGDDAGQLAGAGQHPHPLADGEGVAEAGGPLPALPVGQPQKTVGIDGPHQIAQLIGVGGHQDFGTLPTDPRQHIADAGALGGRPRLLPQSFDGIEYQAFLPDRAGEFC